MKTKLVAATLAIAALFTTSCEQHSWSETSKLFKAHGGEHGEHADHKAHGDADHAEKKAEGHGEAKH